MYSRCFHFYSSDIIVVIWNWFFFLNIFISIYFLSCPASVSIFLRNQNVSMNWKQKMLQLAPMAPTISYLTISATHQLLVPDRHLLNQKAFDEKSAHWSNTFTSKSLVLKTIKDCKPPPFWIHVPLSFVFNLYVPINNFNCPVYSYDEISPQPCSSLLAR